MAIARPAVSVRYAAAGPRAATSVGHAIAGPARGRIVFRDILAPFATAACVGLALSVYIAGAALATSANYDRMRLKEQLRVVRSENELLVASNNSRRSTEAVSNWARSKQMMDDGAAPVVIVGSHE